MSRLPASFPVRRPRAVRLLRSLPALSGCLALLTLAASSAIAAIAVYPTNPTLEQGAARQFSAYVPMTPSTVEWLVNDTVGGNATLGTISPTGAYVAPTDIPSPNVVTIKARSTANPAVVGATPITIVRKYPWLWSVSPASVPAGAFQVSLNGANFAADSRVLINGAPATTIYVSPTKLLVQGSATAAGTVQLAVQQPGTGTVTGNSVSLAITNAPVVVNVSPAGVSLLPGAKQKFNATVTGVSDPSVTWSVITGAGTIDSTGLYTAPGQMPASALVVVRALSVASPSSAGTMALTLVAPPPPPIVVGLAPTTATVQLGSSTTFTATVTGTANTAVTWTVSPGGGSINAATGVYTAPASMPASHLVTLTAKSAANGTSLATATVTLTPPPPAVVSLSAARFLEQSSFGPSPASLAEFQQKGLTQFLADQFALPVTPIPLPPTNSMGELRQWMLHHYTTAPDQLRQRVAYALSQIIVCSANKLVYPDQMLPWLEALNRHAFGNYRALLKEVTLSPSMGHYLDLAFSEAPTPASAANENYARELMQLFTIGLWELNPDGSHRKDANNQSIPTYNQATVQQLSLALTGWVYANNAYLDFSAPMVAKPSRHSTVGKSILGVNFPPGRSAEQELEQVLDVLMAHPNTAPFIATRLIRSLVMSNPSPAYIERVAAKFANNGSNVAGDLKAVITAILLDPEARDDIPQAHSGRLKDPILHTCGFLRALGGHYTSNTGLAYLFEYVAQAVLTPNSVFSWFSPLFRLPHPDPAVQLAGPEFQIYSPTDSSLRGNYLYALLRSNGTDAVVNLAPFQPYANDMPGLVEAANQALLYGRMPAEIKSAIITAAAPGATPQMRIETALYLTALTGHYAVQH